MSDKLPDKRRSSGKEIADFLSKARAVAPRAAAPTARLIFTLDATASREATWDRAAHLHGEMFSAADQIGGLAVQLAWFRGFGEFKAGAWTEAPRALLDQMTAVRCLGGQTQIKATLKHALAEHARKKVNAVVLVGDAFEENVDAACHLAGQLGLKGVPVFLFQEGDDPTTRRAFDQIAMLTKGARVSFDLKSGETLKRLLGAVASFAAGGRKGLKDYALAHGGAARLLLDRME